MAECRTCHAEIRWVTTAAKGEPMPLDLAPAENGNILLKRVGGKDVATVLAGEALAGARSRDTPLYLSHFVTCPYAAEHRKRKEARMEPGTPVWYNDGDGRTLALIAGDVGDKTDLIVFDRKDGQSSRKENVPRRDPSDYGAEGGGVTWHPIKG